MHLTEEEIILSDGRPSPTNAALKELLDLTHYVVIKEGGVSDGKALGDTIVLTLEDAERVETFVSLFQINDPEEWFYCLCSGNYAIELYSHGELVATIGLHHGHSIRYDSWTGDAELSDSDALLGFIASQGLSKPLEDRVSDLARAAAWREPYMQWLDKAPRVFEGYLSRKDMTDEHAFTNMISGLNEEIPDIQKRIITLLQCYGNSENLWNSYPVYEMLPGEILQTIPLKEITEAYYRSDRNYKTRIGLGRYLCVFGFNAISKEEFEYIPDELIDDLENCFKNLHDEKSADNIRHLRNEKQKSQG